MSHQPHWPQLYVCESCHAVFAGVHTPEDPEYHYEPPESCSACGADAFRQIQRMPSR